MYTDASTETSGLAADQDEDVAAEMDRLLGKNYVFAFENRAELRQYLGEDPVVSELIIITKTSGGITKKRMLVNLKKSGVSRSSRKSERVGLPRALDVIWEALDLLKAAKQNETSGELTQLILDFENAVFQVPLLPTERKYAVIRFRGKFWVFVRAPQGSRGAPLLWARTCSLACRLALSTCRLDKHGLNCYVDDP